MPIKTALTRALGIKHPIIQGGMHHVGFAPLAAAVSNAGGLGTITALTQPSPEALREEIQLCKSLTSEPFAVNLTLLPALAPPNYEEYAIVVEEEKIPCVETAGHFNGLAPFVERFKAAGIFVIHKCVAVRHAKSAARLGVDMISMDGFECAGHPGERDTGNWLLLAMAAKQLEIPFVASGGCATGEQLAAALAIGAEGINMGTRFMATEECPIHPNIKQALVDGDEMSTTLVMRTVGNTERVFKNSAAEEVLRIEAEDPGNFQAFAHLVKGDNYKRSFQVTGNTDDSVWSAGPVMALIDDVPTCDVLLNDIVTTAEGIIKYRLAGMIVDE